MEDTYKTVAETGYELDAGLENHYVLARLDYTLQEEACLRGYLREMTLAFGEGAVSTHETQTGRRLLLAPPGNDDVLEFMDKLRMAMDASGVLRDEDLMEVLEEASQARWESMDIDERVTFCINYDESLAHALKTEMPEDFLQYIEQELCEY